MFYIKDNKHKMKKKLNNNISFHVLCQVREREKKEETVI